MRNLVVNLIISFFLLINCKPVLSYDFAPEVGDLAPDFRLEGINNSIKSKKDFEDWINEVEYELGSHSLKGISSVSIGLVSKNTIQDLNKTYRKKDKPTNVLAFASYPGLKESTNSLGDIAICPEVL